MRSLCLSGKYRVLLTILVTAYMNVFSQNSIRYEELLNSQWRTIANDTNKQDFTGFEQPSFDDSNWKMVEAPHNWDTYEGYRRLKHGNRHGYAWYRKSFGLLPKYKKQRIFLWFEGVGSYATVWVNGRQAGYHAGGRTSFTLDITELVNFSKPNILAVRADHPSLIKNLPWVCGGCSEEWGFSEGSQPMGIFRPVHLIITHPVRIEPFGVHIWNDTTISETSALLNMETEIKNYSRKSCAITLVNKLLDHKGMVVAQMTADKVIPAGMSMMIRHEPLQVSNPHLWSLNDPYLYHLESEIHENGVLIDKTVTRYGIRWISWPIGRNNGSNQFLLNGKPVFINGTAEYEHMMGQSHAFSDEQIHTRVMQVKAAGYNAFRDAHQPHNLRYQEYWEEMGLLWWPQFAAHIWFDTPEFRTNFKTLLADWVKERRNNPAVILWGLENESTLPTAFAEECTALIRELDPTTSSQRKVTTCNGGTGTDWNVIQNWSGTYGGNPAAYGDELQRQLLNGEYGAWRSIDLHTDGPFVQNGTLSEDRMTLLMEMKIRLAESAKSNLCGQFHWLLTSHENPGRIQNGEGLRDIDRIGPVNYKGLFTPWGEPLDAFYMYRANYVSNDREPMVYIVSHTWPGRWARPGKKDSMVVYSNCDEVELFNDIKAISLGKRTREGIGTHFQWDGVDIRYNILYAVGYVNGKPVATDCIMLNHLPAAPHLAVLKENREQVTTPLPGYNYLYRVNCGGPDYTDHHGNVWMADCRKTEGNTWGSKSWTDDFPGMPAFYGSQRRTFDPIQGTSDGKLFQSFRYGRDKLCYEFPVPDGDYRMELYFIEPWYGTGGGLDGTGWRLFDIAVNGKTVIKNLDIWKEAGHDHVLKKTVNVHASGGRIVLSFPNVASGQAIVSAIAIATENIGIVPAPASEPVINNFVVASQNNGGQWAVRSWLDMGDSVYTDNSITFRSLPSGLFGAAWIRPPRMVKSNDKLLARFTLSALSDVYVAMDSRITSKPAWLEGYTNTTTTLETDAAEGDIYQVYSKRFPAGSTVELGNNGNTPASELPMYTIMVCPVSNMAQPSDLRPVTKYEAENAMLYGSGLKSDTLYQKKYIKFTRTNGDTIGWNISVGIADTYSLRFRYINPTGKTVYMNMRIVAADGTILHNDRLEFPVITRKWKTLSATTGTSINAGNYKALLFPDGQEGLGIDLLEVQ